MNGLMEILAEFEKKNICYCVLRNYEFAFGGEINGDVDIIVESSDRSKINEILKSYRYYPFEGDTTHQTRYCGYVPDIKQIVTIDLYWDTPTYNGLPILDGSQVLENRRRYEGVWIPSKEDYFVELVFHPALNKNRYRQHYRDELNRLRQEVDRESVQSHANRLFGKEGRVAVDAALEGDFEKIIANKWQLVFSGVQQQPTVLLTLLWNLIILREIIRPLRSATDYVRPSKKPIIAFVGPDGIGKSTTIENIREVLQNNGINAQVARLGIHSGATPLLRTVRRVFNYISGTPSQSKERQAGEATLGSKSATWKAAIPIVDWVLRYLSAQIKNADVILADRYLHELVVYTEPGIFENLFEPFGPAQCYILEDSDEELVCRSEFDKQSVKQFQDRLRYLDWERISVDGGPDATVDTLLERIVPELLKTMSNLEQNH